MNTPGANGRTIRVPRLLAWYRDHARDLPWRRSRDPYAVWVSEAMLQQTRVDTAIPYYQRFMARFPTVDALAQASEQTVLKHWEGLGYYSRARNLHRAAQQVMDIWSGQIPDTVAELKTLPGIGPYMAGAVASIAFGRRTPVLDGNVERVLCRHGGIRTPPKEAATRRHLWAQAEALVPESGPLGGPGEFNQAMMELGATVCTPRNPGCNRCPVSEGCQARMGGDPEGLPVKAAKRPVPHHDIAVAVVQRAGRVLVVRRPSRGMLGGLWEFPGGRLQGDETPRSGVLRQMSERFGLDVQPGPALTPVPHAFTHRRVTLHPFTCVPNTDAGTPDAGIPDAIRVCPTYHTDQCWVDADGLAQLPLPRAHQHIVAALAELALGERDGVAHG